MSWKPEVIADDSGKWAGNGLRFATREEAEANVRDLRSRWMLVRDTRAVESPDPVNYRWIEGRLVALPEDPCPVCGGKGYVEAGVYTQEPASLLNIPAATRIVCRACRSGEA